MRRFAFLVPVALAVAVSGCAGMLDPFQSNDARTTANNFLQIGLALHKQHSDRGRLMIHGTTKDGLPWDGRAQPLVSWRVNILPYIGEDALAREFRTIEPWDSEHNKKLIPLMPKIFASPAKPAPEGHTYVQQLVGPGAMRHSRPLSTISDGTSNTAAVAEAAEAVPWTKPADIEVPEKFAPGALRAKFAGQFKGGFFVLMWDGSVWVARDDVDEGTLKLLCNPSDGNIIHHDLWRMFAKDGKRNR